jgi:Fic family protein
MLFRPPPLDEVDLRVIAEIEQLRSSLRFHPREPRRWKGQLRRNLRARAIRGSNSIEGYDVTLDDAVALLEEEEALDTDRATVLEIVGYRNPVAELVPGLVTELVAELGSPDGTCPAYVRAAMAHLNLVMIHPFRDGNGRMARALQTLVLARERVLAPEFSSIEEWLGRNTAAYYAVLADTGAGGWHPERSTRPWIRFNLAAHHMQAQTVLRRVDDAGRLWTALEQLTKAGRVVGRAPFALYPAASGLRVRRAVYEKDAEVETGTAARDLRLMVEAGLLEPRGETRARYYVGTPRLLDVRKQVVGDRTPLRDPYADAEPKQLTID